MSYSESDVRALMNEVDHNAAQIAALTARSAEIRKSLVFAAMGAVWEDAHGVQNVEVSGVKLKIECKQSYSLNKAELPAVYAGLSENDRKAIAYKPEISLTGLKNMSADGRARLDKIITTKPALPTVSYGK
jgi:hypothetical protein